MPRSTSRVDSRQCHTRGPGFSHKILKRHCVPRVESHATDASAAARGGTSASIEQARTLSGRIIETSLQRQSRRAPNQKTRISPGISPCPIVEISVSPTLSTHDRQTGGECQLSDPESRATISRVPASNVFCGLLISRRPTVETSPGIQRLILVTSSSFLFYGGPWGGGREDSFVAIGLVWEFLRLVVSTCVPRRSFSSQTYPTTGPCNVVSWKFYCSFVAIELVALNFCDWHSSLGGLRRKFF